MIDQRLACMAWGLMARGGWRRGLVYLGYVVVVTVLVGLLEGGQCFSVHLQGLGVVVSTCAHLLHAPRTTWSSSRMWGIGRMRCHKHECGSLQRGGCTCPRVAHRDATLGWLSPKVLMLILSAASSLSWWPKDSVSKEGDCIWHGCIHFSCASSALSCRRKT